MLLITAIAQAISMNIKGGFILSEYTLTVSLVLVMSLVSSSISLPFMFKLGVEKGRMAYYIMVGVVCAGGIFLAKLLAKDSEIPVNLSNSLPFICIAAVSIYALSWYLSIIFYKKREL